MHKNSAERLKDANRGVMELLKHDEIVHRVQAFNCPGVRASPLKPGSESRNYFTEKGVDRGENKHCGNPE
jgi:hypothetical protein